MASELDNKRVLVIEDEAVIEEQIQLFLEDAGMIVAGSFGNLADALTGAANAEFEIGLVDVNLAGEDSYAVIDKLVERGIPFILMTGYTSEELPAAYAAYPALTKPFEPQALLDVIEQVLAGG
jgi:DNA-binding NtrC family response regulator